MLNNFKKIFNLKIYKKANSKINTLFNKKDVSFTEYVYQTLSAMQSINADNAKLDYCKTPFNEKYYDISLYIKEVENDKAWR